MLKRFLSTTLILLGITSSVFAGGAAVKADYVGAKACMECHRETYYSWKSTMHPYKLSKASPQVIVGDFMSKPVLNYGNQEVKGERIGDDFFITAPTGEKNEIKKYKVQYVIGGFWKQRYVTEFADGSLHILPIQWNVKTREWVDYHGLKKHKPNNGKYWSDKERSYQKNCMGCHTTGSSYKFDEKTETFLETKWADLGVSCEACHGPGSAHVKAPVYSKLDTIVNPAKIPDPRRAAMVCGACHTRGKSKDGKHGYPIRGIKKEGSVSSPEGFCPGDDLEFQYDLKPGLHPDGSSKKHHQQFIDWTKSAHSDAGVACWDCHSPHRKGNANKKQLKLPGSMLCASCHTKVENKGVHGIHSVNNCVGCHMPSTAKTATPFDIRAHSMKVIQPAATIKDGAKQPNSCNLCHYHAKDDPAKLQKVLDDIKKKSYLPQTSK